MNVELFGFPLAFSIVTIRALSSPSVFDRHYIRNVVNAVVALRDMVFFAIGNARGELSFGVCFQVQYRDD